MNNTVRIPYLRLIPVFYLTLWSSIFGIWSFIDGQAVFNTFGLDLAADDFVLQNSGARYLGIATALWVGILFRTAPALLTALSARLTMDLLDLTAGIRTGLLDPPLSGIIQGIIMFIIPATMGIYLIIGYARKHKQRKVRYQEMVVLRKKVK